MFDKNKVKLGIAPIAWTNDDMPDLGKENTFEQCVSEMALAGFTGSEVGNKYPKDPEVLKKALELRGVEICNQWFSSFLITKPFEEVEKEFRAQLTFLKAMGAKVIGASEQSHSVQGQLDTPIFGHKYVMNDEEWDTFCTGMNKLGKIAKEEYGIALTFHHHMGTVVQSLEEVDRMMENTDPEYVSLLFDTGHFTYCGEDPLEVVKKYVHRIKHVHLKDIRPEVVEQVKKENMSFLAGVRAGAFTIPGDGCINYDPIFKVLEDAGVDLIAAETMINIEETLAALDAAASVSSLPVMCTMTVEADGSIFSGGNAVEAAIALEGAGAVAVGINCSVGPDQLVSVVRNIKENVSIPVIAKPNAGMPTIDDQGNAIYSMDAKSFAEHMKVLIENGASVVGGCCGTTPEFIHEISRSLGR